MPRLKILTLLLLGVAGCAPSPLYVAGKPHGTVGEIPRDGRGEPIWAAIRPPPPVAPVRPMPPAPGIAVTPPQ